ncbi:MAG: hypothetical protein WD740_03800 [Anaerolineales bacterium]
MLTALHNYIDTHPQRSRALLFLLICVLAFGLFIPFLGFYWDDWPTIFYTYNQRGAQLVTHFSYDRPFSVWGYWLIGRLGTAPLTWHLAALLVRWGCVLALAWALKPLWPRNPGTILLVGLLFAIYPGYYLQPSAVIFSSHWLAYLFFFISLGAMGRAAAHAKRFWVYTSIGLAAAAVHMFTLEYFVGLEAVRPLFLWFLFSRSEAGQARLKRTLQQWAPYLLLFFLWGIWRLFLLELPAEPYPLVMVSALRADPLGSALLLTGTGLQDLAYILIATWQETLTSFLLAVTSFNMLVLGSAAAAFTLLWWLLARFARAERDAPISDERRMVGEGLALGVLALVAGLTPIWLIGESIAQGDYNLRYILVALFGAALVVVSLLTLLVRSFKARILIVCLLVTLALGSHWRASADYRQDWEAQRQFYWQLVWRAPAFETNTALVSFDRVTKYLGDPMTGNALNVLYPTAEEAPAVGLWNFELNRTTTVRRIENNELLTNDYRGLAFSTQSPQDLVFYTQQPDACLWLLAPSDVNNAFLPLENRALLAHSNTANILAEQEVEGKPPTHIFGAEPAHDWCYYFQKADLARQLGDWPQLLDLMAAAQQQGLSSDQGFEWLPLLEAYAASAAWPQALETSQRIHELDARNDSLLCAAWEGMLQGAPGPQAQAAFVGVNAFAGCSAQ